MTADHERGGEGVSHGEQHCDFCGETVPRVQRIALDGDYERLRTPHAVQYACPECSKRKERERSELPTS